MHNADPLSGFLDGHRAPVLEIVYCDGKPGPPRAEPPAPGAVTCKDHRCDVEHSVRVCFDDKQRIRRIEYRCGK